MILFDYSSLQRSGVFGNSALVQWIGKGEYYLDWQAFHLTFP